MAYSSAVKSSYSKIQGSQYKIEPLYSGMRESFYDSPLKIAEAPYKSQKYMPKAHEIFRYGR